MMQIFKHSYLKYLLLLILAIKSVSYVIENTALCLDEDSTCLVDFNDFENENDEETEIEEIKKIIKIDVDFCFSENDIVLKHHFTSHKNYLTQYLEFSTPPPELV